MDFTFSTNLAGDGELGGIFAVLAKQVREEAATCVDEPVAYLEKERECLALTQLTLLTRKFFFFSDSD